MKKKLFALLLTLALALSLCPGLGLAAEAADADYTLYFSAESPYAMKARYPSGWLEPEKLASGEAAWTLDGRADTPAGCLWEPDTLTLTLKNFVFNTTAPWGLWLPGGSTIVLDDLYASEIGCIGYEFIPQSIGLLCGGDLTIEGTDADVLHLSSRNARDEEGLAVTCGLMVLGELRVEGGILNINSGGADSGSGRSAATMGVRAKSMTLSGGTVNAYASGAVGVDGGTALAAGVFISKALVVTGGKLNAAGGGAVSANSGPTGRAVTAGIVSDGGCISVSGGQVEANGDYAEADNELMGLSAGVAGAAEISVDGGLMAARGEDWSVQPSDISAADWYYDEVQSAYRLGLIDGLTYTEYGPEEPLTCAQAVKLACCMNLVYSGGDPAAYFSGSEPWYREYMAYAKSHGIPWNFMDYDAPISRAEYVDIFYNALPADSFKLLNDIADGSIPDVDMAHPYAAEIYTFYRAGILDGNDEYGSFYPDSGIKRSEVAAILSRMMDSSQRKSGTVFLQDWKTPYRDILSGSRYVSYVLYDVDKNGVPELFMKQGTCEADFMYTVYTCSSGRALHLGEMGAGHGSLYSYPGANGVIYSRGHMGYAEMEYYYIDGGRLCRGENLFDEDITSDPEADYTEPGAIVPGSAYLTEYTGLSGVA